MAAAAAVLGVAMAHGVLRLVVAFASSQVPRTDAIEVNGLSLALAVAVAVVSTAAFAVSRVYGPRGVEPSCVPGLATHGGSHAARRTQRALVVAQVTLAVTVTLGAGLVARSQLHLETLETGLAADRILMAQVVPPRQDDWAGPRRFNANLDRVVSQPWATVIGLAADTRYRELTAIRPTVYLPRAQFEAAPGFLAVRTAGDPIALGPAIRGAGQAVWPGMTFTSLRRLGDYSSEPLARSRVTAALFVGCAAICLLLSTIGLYGVVAAHVAERTREVGIRLALGAQKSVVLRAVLLEGATMTLVGMLGGAPIAALFSGWLESILYGVGRHDPATIAGVALLVCLVTGIAAYVPARRAASVEPTVALRE